MVKNLPAIQETWVQPLSWEDPLEKGKATPSSILAWRGCRVGHDWATNIPLSISIVVHLALSLIAPSFQEALNDTISHPAFIIWLSSSESRVPEHCLLPAACSGGPSVTLPSCCCVSCFMAGACLITSSHSRHRAFQAAEAIRCNLLGPGPSSASKDHSCLPLPGYFHSTTWAKPTSHTCTEHLPG